MLPSLLVLALVAAAQLPAVEDAEVRTAIERYQALDYGAVVPLLEGALARENLTASDRVQALAYLARTHAVYRQPERAAERFAQLLELEPAFEVSLYESPLIREAFAEARQRVVATDTPSSVDAGAAPAPAVTSTAAHVPDADGSGVEEDSSLTTAAIVGAASAAALIAVGGTAVAIVLWLPSETVADGTLGRWDLP